FRSSAYVLRHQMAKEFQAVKYGDNKGKLIKTYRGKKCTTEVRVSRTGERYMRLIRPGQKPLVFWESRIDFSHLPSAKGSIMWLAYLVSRNETYTSLSLAGETHRLLVLSLCSLGEDGQNPRHI